MNSRAENWHVWKPFRIEDFRRERTNQWLPKHYVIALDSESAVSYAREKLELGTIRAVECTWDEYNRRMKAAAQ